MFRKLKRRMGRKRGRKNEPDFAMLHRESNITRTRLHDSLERFRDLSEEEEGSARIGDASSLRQAKRAGSDVSLHSGYSSDSHSLPRGRPRPTTTTHDRPKYNITSTPGVILSPSPIRPVRHSHGASIRKPPVPYPIDEHAESSYKARTRPHHRNTHDPGKMLVDIDVGSQDLEFSTSRRRDAITLRRLDHRRLSGDSSHRPISPELRDIEVAEKSSRARDCSRRHGVENVNDPGVAGNEQAQVVEVSTPRNGPPVSPGKPVNHHLRRVSAHLPDKPEAKKSTQEGIFPNTPVHLQKPAKQDPHLTNIPISERPQGKKPQIISPSTCDHHKHRKSSHAPVSSESGVFFRDAAAQARPREQVIEDPDGFIKLITVHKKDRSDRALLLPDMAYLHLRVLAGVRQRLKDLNADRVAIAKTIDELEAETRTTEAHKEKSVPGSFLDDEQIQEAEARCELLSTLARRISVNMTRLNDLDQQKARTAKELSAWEASFLEDVVSSLQHVQAVEGRAGGVVYGFEAVVKWKGE